MSTHQPEPEWYSGAQDAGRLLLRRSALAVGRRYEAQKPIILTSNKSYGQWDEIFPDSVLATALLDRLLHHATTINIRGESCRLRNRRGAGLIPSTTT